MSQLQEDRFSGSMLGVAVGDALGQPIEAFPPERLWSEFGPIRDFMPGDTRLALPLGAGQWTDDTQMTLDLLRSLLRCGGMDPADVAAEFLRDHETDGIRFSGFTIKYSILRLKGGLSWEESGLGDDQTQSNGGAMCVAPLGLLNALHPERLPEDVRRETMITHRHPEAIAGALAVASMVARAASGTLNLDTAIDDTIQVIGDCKVAEHLVKTKQILQADLDTPQALKKIGTTGYILHTVGAAFYCFLKTPEDFETSVIAAVMGGYDADTTAAVVGGISGAYNGESAIPTRWREGVERGPEIKDMAQQLYQLVVGN